MIRRFKVSRLERLARNRKPGYLDALRACKLPESTETEWVFDADSECYAGMSAFRTGAPAKKASIRNGPGDAVKLVLERMGFKSDVNGLVCANGKRISTCNCAGFQRQMNEWGWGGCVFHAGEIIAWFREKAAMCGFEISIEVMWEALTAAWDEIRDREKS